MEYVAIMLFNLNKLLKLNKPKLAVLIVGEYRTFEYCRKTMTFLNQNNLNIDVYFSTWDKTNTVNNKENPVYETVSIEQIKEDISIPDASIHIHQANPSSITPMIDGWLLGFDLIRNSKTKYDYALVLRPDLFFKDAPAWWPWHLDIDVTTLPRYKDGIGVEKLSDNGLDDTIFFSTYDNLNKLLSTNIVDYIKNNANPEHITAPEMHRMWYDYIININNLKIYEVPVRRQRLIARYPMTKKSTFTDVESNWENAWKEAHGEAYDRS